MSFIWLQFNLLPLNTSLLSIQPRRNSKPNIKVSILSVFCALNIFKTSIRIIFPFVLDRKKQNFKYKNDYLPFFSIFHVTEQRYENVQIKICFESLCDMISKLTRSKTTMVNNSEWKDSVRQNIHIWSIQNILYK